ncbi:hypothetical protein V8B97DRAFT_1153946 [Scleroderma yunnanense]
MHPTKTLPRSTGHTSYLTTKVLPDLFRRWGIWDLEPGTADVNINFIPGLDTTLELYTLNKFSFVDPPLPILLQTLSRKRHSSQLPS